MSIVPWCNVATHSSGYRLSSSQEFLNTRATAQVQVTPCIQLPFYRLTCFELITDQFQAWGVQIKDAIAIKPSNFALFSQPDQIVLVPLTRHNRITVQFNQPCKNVSVFLVAPRPVQLITRSSDRPLSMQCTSRHPVDLEQADELQPLPSQCLQETNDNITQIILNSISPFAVQAISYS